MTVVKRRAAKVVDPEPEQVELTTTFIKPGIWKVTGNGEYTVTLLPNGFFQIKEGKEIINPKIKGMANVNRWLEEFDLDIDEDDEDDEEPIKPVRAKSTPAAAKAAKIKPFMDFETWLEESDEGEKYHATKSRRESQVDFDKQLKTAKMRYGLAKSRHEKGNGVNTTPKPAAVKMSKEERFGEPWNSFGEPDMLAYELSRVENARASVAYSIEHSKVHPHSSVAQGSLYKALERQYESEKRLQEYTDSNPKVKLPKDYSHELYGVTLDDIKAYDESLAEVLEQYVEYYEQNNSGKMVREKQEDGTFIERTADGYVLLPIVDPEDPEPIKPTRRTRK